MTERSKLPAAATGLRRKMKVNHLIMAVRVIVAAGRKNKALPKPFPTLTQLAKALAALEAAQVAAQSRGVGTVPARNTLLARVFAALAAYKSAVQTVAHADPANAATIIVNSGLRTRRPSTRRKAFFSVKRGPVSRSLRADVKAVAKRASYEWEISVDGGKTWIHAKTTTQAGTVISDLPLGKTVKVRCRPITKTGPGQWIGPIAVLVT